MVAYFSLHIFSKKWNYLRKYLCNLFLVQMSKMDSQKMAMRSIFFSDSVAFLSRGKALILFISLNLNNFRKLIWHNWSCKISFFKMQTTSLIKNGPIFFWILPPVICHASGSTEVMINVFDVYWNALDLTELGFGQGRGLFFKEYLGLT